MAQLNDGDPAGRSPAHQEVRDCLHHLLDRNELNASERNRRFLSYVVEETLAGRGNRIKAYNIALAAFNRGEDFDPLTDPIVRIEASRLRRSLEHYYLTAGKSDKIRIDIPKGSYAATFSYVDQPTESTNGSRASIVPPAATPSVPPPVQSRHGRGKIKFWGLAAAGILLGLAAWAGLHLWRDMEPATGRSRGPAIVVLPFEDVGGDPSRAFVARALTDEIIAALTRFDDLFVFGPETSYTLQASGTARRVPESLDVDYALTGSVHPTSSKIRISAVLSDVRTGQYLWTWNGERDLTTSDLIDVQSEISDAVVNAIAQPNGVLFERTAKEIAAKPTKDLSSYECVVKFRQYWRRWNADEFDSVRECLERTIELDPSYARAYSSLSLAYIDSYRFHFGRQKSPSDPLQRALELANKAKELAPNSSEVYLALSLAHWFLNHVDQSIEAAEQGLALNPHNTDLLADLGVRYALLARWDKSRPLIEEAYARNPAANVGYHIATFLRDYMQADYHAALDAALQVDSPDVLYGHVARAMAYAQLGDSAKAKAAVLEILKIDPGYGAHVADDLRKRNIDAGIIRAIVEGLAKAGLSSASSTSAG